MPGHANSRTPLFHRNLSWLAFNERVLGEAADQTVPPLERLHVFVRSHGEHALRCDFDDAGEFCTAEVPAGGPCYASTIPRRRQHYPVKDPQLRTYVKELILKKGLADNSKADRLPRR